MHAATNRHQPHSAEQGNWNDKLTHTAASAQWKQTGMKIMLLFLYFNAGSIFTLQ